MHVNYLYNFYKYCLSFYLLQNSWNIKYIYKYIYFFSIFTYRPSSNSLHIYLHSLYSSYYIVSCSRTLPPSTNCMLHTVQGGGAAKECLYVRDKTHYVSVHFSSRYVHILQLLLLLLLRNDFVCENWVGSWGAWRCFTVSLYRLLATKRRGRKAHQPEGPHSSNSSSSNILDTDSASDSAWDAHDRPPKCPKASNAACFISLIIYVCMCRQKSLCIQYAIYRYISYTCVCVCVASAACVDLDSRCLCVPNERAPCKTCLVSFSCLTLPRCLPHLVAVH